MSNATEVAAMAADVEGQPEEGQPNAWIAAQTQPPPGGCRKFIDKGSVSNFITFTIMTTHEAHVNACMSVHQLSNLETQTRSLQISILKSERHGVASEVNAAIVSGY